MRELILVGSNHNLRQLVDAAHGMGYTILGVLDHDYFGNQTEIADIKIIGSEKTHDFDHDHDYFVATNWIADRSSVQKRNLSRRQDLMQRLMAFNLVNIIHPRAKVADSVVMGKGIFVGADAQIGHGVSIGDGAQIKEQSYTAHDVEIGAGVVLQVQSYVGAWVRIGLGSYVGVGARLVPAGKMIIRDNSFIKSHSMITESNAKTVRTIEWS